MSYVQKITEARRLEILRFLSETPGYEAGEGLIYQAITVTGSADQVAADLAWLAEQGLVTLESPGGYALATITRRGLDAACGKARVPGVARPLPGV